MKAHNHDSEPGRLRHIANPPLAVRRLSLYLRFLEELAEAGETTVSSQQLGDGLALTDAQVRKDLASFGQFGRPGVGYRVGDLTDRLRAIFGTDKTWNVAVIGVGSLGRALLHYKGFLRKGFALSAAFDVDPAKVGRRIGDVLVQHLDELAETVKARQLRLALLAVPTEAAAQVAAAVRQAGIRGILNFAPVNLALPEDVAVVPVDVAVQLEQLSYLVTTRPEPKPAPTEP
jgi:redox-sensing transcriptional repressor